VGGVRGASAAAGQAHRHLRDAVLRSGEGPDGTPSVAVGKTYDTLLASNRRDDIVRARDEINRNNSLVTPMTLMVLAIRLYDVGLRDDSVFWFLRGEGPLRDARRRVRHEVARARAGRGCREELRVLAGPSSTATRSATSRAAGAAAEGLKWASTTRTRPMFMRRCRRSRATASRTSRRRSRRSDGCG
jgi:hypothetical protein